MKSIVHTATTAFSLARCFAFMRFVALALTVLSGVWSLVLQQDADLIMADRLGLIHAVSAFTFLVLVGWHLWSNRHVFAQIYRQPVTWRSQSIQAVLPFILALITASAVSGIVIMTGGVTALAFHIGAGTLLLLIALVHITIHMIK